MYENAMSILKLLRHPNPKPEPKPKPNPNQDTVAIIAPKRLPSAPFIICAVWADKAGSSSADAGAGGACMIEARWDGASKLDCPFPGFFFSPP